MATTYPRLGVALGGGAARAGGPRPHPPGEAAGGRGRTGGGAVPPNYRAVVIAALDIMQDRISRSRLAGDPPDLLLSPRVGHVPPLEFAGGRATIREGYNVVRRMMSALSDLLGMERSP